MIAGAHPVHAADHGPPRGPAGELGREADRAHAGLHPRASLGPAEDLDQLVLGLLREHLVERRLGDGAHRDQDLALALAGRLRAANRFAVGRLGDAARVEQAPAERLARQVRAHRERLARCRAPRPSCACPTRSAPRPSPWCAWRSTAPRSRAPSRDRSRRPGRRGRARVGLPIWRETWSIKRAGSIGFSRKAFAPAVIAVRITSAPRNTPLIAISGIPRVASAACSTPITAWPSFLGSSRSINTRSGRAFATASSAAFPS